MIICILGYPGSGKTALAREVGKFLNIPLVEVSEFVKRASGNEDAHKRRDLQNFNKEEFEKKDYNWLWSPLCARLFELEGRCIVCGIREPYLLHKILEEFSDVLVIGLDVSLFNRYSRLCKRDQFIGVEKFRLSDNGTIDDKFIGDNTLGLDITMTRCDVIINGNLSFSDVVGEVRKVLMDRRVHLRSK